MKEEKNNKFDIYSLKIKIDEEKAILTEKQSILLEYLYKEGNIITTRKMLSKNTNLKIATISSILKSLEKKGYIEYRSVYLHYYKLWAIEILVYSK